MNFVFDNTARTAISSALSNASTNGYVPVYQAILNAISDVVGSDLVPKSTLTDAERNVWLWVRGAMQVNADDGSFFLTLFATIPMNSILYAMELH